MSTLPNEETISIKEELWSVKNTNRRENSERIFELTEVLTCENSHEINHRLNEICDAVDIQFERSIGSAIHGSAIPPIQVAINTLKETPN